MKVAGADVISLGAGEPDFNTPESIRLAAAEALESGLTKYCPSRGLPALVEAIQRKTKRENKFESRPEQIVVSCGAKHSLYNAFQVLLNPGDEVILFAPFWMTYADQIALAGGTPKIVNCRPENGYVPDPEELIAAISPRTKAIVVNSPTNPTGGAWDRSLIEQIAQIAVRHELTIISDEIYERIIYNHEHVSFASLGKEVADRTITILGVSKTYSMTGWRIGFSVSPPPIAQAMANIQDQTTSNATTFAQAGAVAALDSDPALAENMRRTFAERRQLGLELIGKIPRVRIVAPKGAFYFFIDVSDYLGGHIATDLELADHLLENVHLAVIPGSVFHGDGHLRLSYAASPDAIREGVSRLSSCLEGLA